ncbi:ABC transporter permease [Ruegeria sp. EL01]|jgi:simple sugar transport system permease protein|uniref:ABC transporter permease n=1 Tax=Ruegeria sp. EL01 TaxID=2107578 RepID=UPI000EA7FD4F|nr:ABC transporter permease [Ruegeria sp. EL01]
MNSNIPKWVDIGLIPGLNLLIAFALAGIGVLVVGESPYRALTILLQGALGSSYGIGYTLFYATSFVFTGLAVAVAAHAGHFNIGGEGQAGVGGIGVALICLSFLGDSHWLLVFPIAVLAAVAFGVAWAFVPAYLQARRGSHIVITTIMFNFIAAALLVYLLVNVLKVEGTLAPESRRFGEGARIPQMNEVGSWFGLQLASTPWNISFFVAVAACVFTWLLIWKSKLGYEMRAFGASAEAAVYAGISPFKITMVAMTISGAMAGMMALNTVMGESQRLILDAVQGAGFVGIAVALMGRSHPVGIFLAAVLFGILFQGGAELAFEMPAINRDLIVMIQGLVILFTGALENMIRWPISSFFDFRATAKEAAQ